MSDEIVKFDPSKLAEQVQARVRGAIVDLIPEDAWKQMIQREIKLWMDGEPSRPSPHGRSYNDIPARDPGIRAVVRAELEKIMKAKVVELLGGPEWTGFWDGQNGVLGSEMAKIVTEHAGDIMRSILSNAMVGFVSQMRNSIGQ